MATGAETGMAIRSIEVVIVGGGQAGLALSFRLTELGIEHVVLEQGQTIESWRSRRWDSLRLIAPNWSLRMPGFEYSGADPDGFMERDEVVDHLVGYAQSFDAPVCEGVRVVSVERDPIARRFVIRSEDEEGFEAAQVVLATGALQRPNLPPSATEIPGSIRQIAAPDYRNPDSLPYGAVLVVGSGDTGVQIAEELVRAGRIVLLSGGRSWWAPRRYRGLDIARWLRLVGWFDRTVDDLPPGARTGKPNPQLTGANGGHDISSRTVARDGVRLFGRLKGIRDGVAYFADDLAENIAWADDQARQLLRDIDAVVEHQGLQVPPADLPAGLGTDHGEPETTPASIDLRVGVGSVIWATGYRPAFDWIALPFTDEAGYPIQRRGVTEIPGLYVLGLDWLHSAKSGLFAGIDEDATYLASVMVTTR